MLRQALVVISILTIGGGIFWGTATFWSGSDWANGILVPFYAVFLIAVGIVAAAAHYFTETRSAYTFQRTAAEIEN